MKNLKCTQKLVLITTVLISLFLLLIYWYKQNYPVNATHSHEGNFYKSEQKLLIATQNSPFKDSITAIVSDHYKSIPIVVAVIDVADLANLDIIDFDVLLLIYRWEANAPPQSVQSFMNKNSRLKNKIVVLTTSWNGLEKVKNIDAITGASILENVPSFTNKIIRKLNPMLK